MTQIVLLIKPSQISFEPRLHPMQRLKQTHRRQELRLPQQQRILPLRLTTKSHRTHQHDPQKNSRSQQPEPPQRQHPPTDRCPDNPLHPTSPARPTQRFNQIKSSSAIDEPPINSHLLLSPLRLMTSSRNSSQEPSPSA